MQSVIGIDIGTTNTKAVALTKQGKVIATQNASYGAISPQQGYHELDPVDILNAVVTVLLKITEQIRSSSEILGVSFSCAMHSLTVIGQNGDPMIKFMTWADLRSAEEAARLKNTEIGNQIYELTGTPIHPMSPLCKILWLRNNRPEIFSKAFKFIGIKEYLWYQFFGKYQIDQSLASATGLFNIYECKWNEDSLKLLTITPDKLSEIVEPIHTEKNLSKKYLEAFQLNSEIPFIIGGSDGCLANLGSNAIHEGATSLTIGTSGALRMACVKPKHDSQQRIFNYILTKNLYIAGGAMNNGGSVLHWYLNNFLPDSSLKEKDFSEIISIADDVDSEGLIFLPYLFGERAPVWNANAKAVFFGINPNHRQKHFLRSIIEGICFSIYQIGISVEETAGPIQKIYASGGFIQSRTWLQIIADVFNKEVVVVGVSDASAVGAAILGMQAVGLINDFVEITNTFSIQESFFPDTERNKAYKKNIEKFTSLYDKLKDEF